MEVEGHGFVSGEQGIEVPIRKAVRMFSRRLQGIQIDDVDEADLEIRQALTKDSNRGEASCVRMSPALATTTSGFAPWSLLAHSQMSMPLVQWHDRGIHVKIDWVGLLVRNDHLEVVFAAQTVVRHAQ